jgi:hypothetical protein
VQLVYSQGGGTVFFPYGNYVIRRRAGEPFPATGGGIDIMPGVNMIGQNATITNLDNDVMFSASYSNNQNLAALTAHINADVAVGATTLNVDSTTPFAVGTEIYIQCYQNPTDGPENQFFTWAKVTAVGTGTITIDTPMNMPGPLTVSTQNPINLLITTFPQGIFQNMEVAGFNLVTAGPIATEAGIAFTYFRNIYVHNVSCVNPGSGCVGGQYGENMHVVNAQVKGSLASGHSSWGRGFGAAEVKNFKLENISVAGFESNAIGLESSATGSVRNVFLHDTVVAHTGSSPMFSLLFGSHMSLEDVTVDGIGSQILVDLFGATQASWSLKNLNFNAKNFNLYQLKYLTGQINIYNGTGGNNLQYSTFSPAPVPFSITLIPGTNNTSGAVALLPAGLYQSVNAYVSNSGITALYLVGDSNHNSSNLFGSLIPGSLVDLGLGAVQLNGSTSFSSWNGWLPTSRQVSVATDSTFPSNGYLTLSGTYWPSSSTMSTGVAAGTVVGKTFFGPVAGSETVVPSATPTFSVTTRASINTLSGNVTSFTLAAGADGQQKVLTFCQPLSGVSYTVAGPSNVHGFFTVGTTLNKCNTQSFTYSVGRSAWLAENSGVINQ